MQSESHNNAAQRNHRNPQTTRRWLYPVVIGCLGAFLLCISLYTFARRRHDASPNKAISSHRSTAVSGPVGATLRPNSTLERRLQEFGEAARSRLRPAFRRVGMAYPPRSLTLVGLKQERRMEVYVTDRRGRTKFLTRYPILAASGRLGPKLREGDYQVPEGFYQVVFLNPNSRYHVSLRLDYPNAFDREQAARERRDHLGGDIMIHGSAVSAGCLAMGDVVAEDLFTLVADTGQEQVTVILSPMDLRTQAIRPDPLRPVWLTQLYTDLQNALRHLPVVSFTT